jgi:hypothetical protein
MQKLWVAIALVTTSTVLAQEPPPAPAPVVPDEPDEAAPEGRRAGRAAAREMLQKRGVVFERAGLAKEDLRRLLKTLQPLMRGQRDLQTQLQSLAALLTNEGTPDEEIAAAVKAFEQLRDEVLAEREEARRQITADLAEPVTPRVEALLLMLGLTDNGLRLGRLRPGLLRGERGRGPLQGRLGEGDWP